MTKKWVKELSYYLFFALMIFAKGIGLDSGNRFYYILSGAACACVGVKLVLTKYRMREIAAMVLLCAIAFAAYRNSGRLGIVLSVLTIIGLKDMDVKKLFRMGTVIYGCSFAFTVIAAKFGFIGNPLVVHEKGGMELIRWGMGYSTGNVFHVSYFMLAVLLCYTWGKYYNWKRMLGLMAGNLLVFLYTLSYTGVLVTGFYLLLNFYAVKRAEFCRVKGKEFSTAERMICQLPLPLCLLFSFGGPFLLNYPAMQKLDSMLQARLSYSAYYLQNQPVTLLGTRMKDVPNFWVIMDNGYVYFFMTFGVAAFVLFCAGYMVVIGRYSGIGKCFAGKRGWPGRCGEKRKVERVPEAGWLGPAGKHRRPERLSESEERAAEAGETVRFTERLPELAMIFSFLLYGVMEQFLSNAFMNFSLLFLGEVLFGRCGVKYEGDWETAGERGFGKKWRGKRISGEWQSGTDACGRAYAGRGAAREGMAGNVTEWEKRVRRDNGTGQKRKWSGELVCGIFGLAVFAIYYFLVPVKEYICVPVGTLNYVKAQSIQINVTGSGEVREGRGKEESEDVERKAEGGSTEDAEGKAEAGGKVENKEAEDAGRKAEAEDAEGKMETRSEEDSEGDEGEDALQEKMKAYGEALEKTDILAAALHEMGVEDRLSEAELAAALEYSIPVSMRGSEGGVTFRVRLLELYYDITEEEYRGLLEYMVAQVQEEGNGQYSLHGGVYGEKIGKSAGDDRIEHMSKDKAYEVEKAGNIVKMEHFRDSVFSGVFGIALAAAVCEMKKVLVLDDPDWEKEFKAEKMRIAIDLTSLADNFSGIERYAMNIARELIEMDRKGKHTYILLFKRKVHPEFQKYQKKKNVVMKVYKGQNKLLFAQILLPFHLYAVKADIFLFLAFQSPVLFRHKGIYNTVHDLTCWDCPETMKKHMEWYFKLSIINALLVSRGILVISRFTRERVINKLHYNRRKIILAYCGISQVFMDYVENQPGGSGKDKAEQEEAARNRFLDVRHKYHLPEQYLLCLATLEPRKNLPLLVEAYVELLEEGRVDVPLVLAGRKGWKMDEFLERIETEYRQKIIVTGFIEDADLPYVYHMADCFIFPSVYEGFGMPPLEAMAVGTLTISSDAASLPEVLGNAAAYFHPYDKDGLKERICQGIQQQCGNVTVSEIQRRIHMFQWRRSAARVAKRLGLDLQRGI